MDAETFCRIERLAEGTCIQHPSLPTLALASGILQCHCRLLQASHKPVASLMFENLGVRISGPISNLAAVTIASAQHFLGDTLRSVPVLSLSAEG